MDIKPCNILMSEKLITELDDVFKCLRFKRKII